MKMDSEILQMFPKLLAQCTASVPVTVDHVCQPVAFIPAYDQMLNKFVNFWKSMFVDHIFFSDETWMTPQQIYYTCKLGQILF